MFQVQVQKPAGWAFFAEDANELAATRLLRDREAKAPGEQLRLVDTETLQVLAAKVSPVKYQLHEEQADGSFLPLGIIYDTETAVTDARALLQAQNPGRAYRAVDLLNLREISPKLAPEPGPTPEEVIE